MAFILYDIQDHAWNKSYPSKRGVKIAHKRLGKKYAGQRSLDWTTNENFRKNVVKTKVVKNMMSGEDVVISTDTPRCCDPSTELYWSM